MSNVHQSIKMSKTTESGNGIAQTSNNLSYETNSAQDPMPLYVPPLESLPLEIRMQIYENLLISHHVKEVSSGVAHYRFQPAILATNHAINQEALPFLRKNVFVLVFTDENVCKNLNGAGLSLNGEGLRIVSDHHLDNFNECSLHVRLDIPAETHGPPQAFLMMAEDLPKLARYIRMRDLMIPVPSSLGIIQLQLRLTAHPKTTLPIQKLLSDPFKRVRGRAMQIQITGQVDASYREKVLRNMTPKKTLTVLVPNQPPPKKR